MKAWIRANYIFSIPAAIKERPPSCDRGIWLRRYSIIQERIVSICTRARRGGAFVYFMRDDPKQWRLWEIRLTVSGCELLSRKIRRFVIFQIASFSNWRATYWAPEFISRKLSSHYRFKPWNQPIQAGAILLVKRLLKFENAAGLPALLLLSRGLYQTYCAMRNRFR